jgi:hypothetical protein
VPFTLSVVPAIDTGLLLVGVSFVAAFYSTTNAFPGALDSFPDAFTSAFDSLTDTFAGTFDAFSCALTKFFDPLSCTFSEALHPLSCAFADLLNARSNARSDFLDAFTCAFADLLDRLSNATREVTDDLRVVVDGFDEAHDDVLYRVQSNFDQGVYLHVVNDQPDVSERSVCTNVQFQKVENLGMEAHVCLEVIQRELDPTDVGVCVNEDVWP